MHPKRTPISFHAAALTFLPCYLVAMHHFEQVFPMTFGRASMLTLFYLLVLIPLYLYLRRPETPP
ncbi:hypothetical protein GCM10007391_19980 [Alteromonas halophila]|uniref:Uncharacterized protein n=2 Tax=Alteromonas halophila TaxID=516698 RepID=A0A918MY00_9ALTE|nr:hypothetical protein GCM10007391_19980 [Alteromonas halophila]